MSISMRPIQTIDEAKKYLSYVADALAGVASSYGVDKHDRETLEKFAGDMLEYLKALEQFKLNLSAKEQAKRRIQVNAELEQVYDNCKRVTKNAQENVRITDLRLKEVEKDGTKKDIDEYKRRLAFYMREYLVAQRNEALAKRAMNEQGA